MKSGKLRQVLPLIVIFTMIAGLVPVMPLEVRAEEKIASEELPSDEKIPLPEVDGALGTDVNNDDNSKVESETVSIGEAQTSMVQSETGVYNSSDIAVINNIIDNNGLDWEKSNGTDIPESWCYYDDGRDEWRGVFWTEDETNKRIWVLDLQSLGLLGTLDVSGLDSLERLDCYGNQLTGLIVNGLGSLENLNCSANQLTNLDVSELNSLKRLDCYENELTKLNVNSLDLLEELYCSENLLAELNVNEASSLRVLGCYENRLTELDISGLSLLEELHCARNKLTVLDVNGLSLLTWLVCDENQLTELNVNNLNSLGHLYCSQNKLTKLDVSGLGLLKELVCSNNQLTTLQLNDAAEYERIDVRYNRIVSKSNVIGGDIAWDETNSSGWSRFMFLPQNVVVTPSPVANLKAESAGKKKVKLTWTASADTDGYLIYAQKNGKYGYCGMTTMGTTYTDSAALDTDYSFYWVFPYKKDSNGKMHPGGCTKYVFAKGVCPAVTNLKAASVIGGVKLTWTKSPDADGYLIYGKTEKGAYGYRGMTTQGITYTDTKASKSEYNFYWVFPYHKDPNGKMIVGGTPKYVYGKAK